MIYKFTTDFFYIFNLWQENKNFMSTNLTFLAILGRIPKTSVLEEKENKLQKEFEEYTAYLQSDEYNRYKELEAFVTSKEFEEIKKEINAKKYPGSEPGEKEKKYNELKKSKRIKTYYQVKDSKELKDYESFKVSEKLANYEELNQFFTSPEFEDFKKSLLAQKEEKTKEIKEKQAKHKELKAKYKWFFALKDSKQLSGAKAFAESKELEDYKLLEQYIKGLNVSAINKKENPEEFQQLTNFKKLSKSSKIKSYFKFIESDKYKKFIELDGSEEIEAFVELDKEVNSAEFKAYIDEVKNIKFEKTEEFKKLQEYKNLKKSTDIKQYYKFRDSEKLKIYTELFESQEIADYEALQEYINSNEFKEEKKYLLTKDKFKLSDEFKQEQEYKELVKSEKLKWFKKLEKHNEFAKLDEWELTFEDNFDDKKLNSEKWMSGYYWGKNLLNDDYVQVNEKQFFKETNLELANSNLKIITKPEKSQGKVWDPKAGFYVKEFDYTSGLINTGQYFRQQYGLFKAKIKVNHSYPAHHAFWLLGEKITPEIDIFKYSKKSASQMEIANYWSNGTVAAKKQTVSGLNFSNDYFIYSLEWTKDKLIWRLNDIVLYEQTEGVPQEPMYIVLSSGIANEGNVSPCQMEVDWVRAYKRKEK